MFIELESLLCFNQKHNSNQNKNTKIHDSTNLKKKKGGI